MKWASTPAEGRLQYDGLVSQVVYFRGLAILERTSSGGTALVTVELYKNGVATGITESINIRQNDNVTLGLVTPLKLDPGDYIEIFGYSVGTQTYDVHAYDLAFIGLAATFG